MLKLLDRTVSALIGLVAVALLVTAFGQVIARYVFNRPFTWVLELDVMLLVWLTMLSGYVGVRRNLHMAVDFVVAKWRPGARRAMALASLVLSAGFAAVVLWASFPVIGAMEGMIFASLGLAQNWMYWSVPAGAALMLVAFAVALWRQLGGSGAPP
jgi:TRAP-type C4-dicarboxylate transport system permease small subunit